MFNIIDKYARLVCIDDIMTEKRNIILPRGKAILSEFGENIKLARLRRKLRVEQVAERAGISRATLWSIEKGKETVSLGAYFQVLFVLGLEKDLLKVAKDDVLGRKLQDIGILTGKRASKRLDSTK